MPATLADIRTKIRRLTRSPSDAQISDAQIDDYINTFVLYDFPEHLRFFISRKTLTFYTSPNVERYQANAILNDPLFDFNNRIISIHPPVYIAGYESFFTQSESEFFRIYPQVQTIASTGLTGDGIQLTFTGTLPAVPVMRNDVIFSSIDAGNNALILVDVPFNGTSGNLVIPDNPAPAFLDPNNNINYLTGVFTVTFQAPPAVAEPIMSATIPYQAARPIAMMYYANIFVLRPVPDAVYSVNMEAYLQPTAFLSTNVNQHPELDEYWQFISYGAAKKIFEDRMDLESVQMIMPEFKQQERLILRRTIVQNTNERVATIYTDNIGAMYGGGWFSGGGSF